MISYYPKNQDFTHFRVDRMTEILVLEERCQDQAEVTGGIGLDIAEYSKKHFNMFNGEVDTVKLEFDNSLINVVIDRYGKDVTLVKTDETHFNVMVEVAVSSTFFGWVFQFGDKVKILSPECVAEKYREMLQKSLDFNM